MPSIPNSKRFFTVSEFAELTGDSQSTIRREIRTGNLPFLQSGPRKKIRIPLEALEIRSEASFGGPDAEANQGQQQNQPEKIPGPNPDWLD
jgi:excisionase family DNA binding protein